MWRHPSQQTAGVRMKGYGDDEGVKVVTPQHRSGGQIEDIMHIVQLFMDAQENRRSVRAVKGGAREYFSFNDLTAMGSSPAALREKIKSIYGSNPAGLAVNHETYYNAVTPAITEQYGNWCYKTPGEYQFTQDVVDPDSQQVVGGSNYAYNRSSASATITVQVKGSFTETDSWDCSITTGMSYSAEVGIEGILKIGSSFSVSVSEGRSGSKSSTQEVTHTVAIDVPPGKKCKVSIMATSKSESMDYKVPIDVDGYFGSNFDYPVGGGGGHYYWFNHSSQVLPRQSGELTGTIKCVRAMDAQTEVGEFEDI